MLKKAWNELNSAEKWTTSCKLHFKKKTKMIYTKEYKVNSIMRISLDIGVGKKQTPWNLQIDWQLPHFAVILVELHIRKVNLPYSTGDFVQGNALRMKPYEMNGNGFNHSAIELIHSNFSPHRKSTISTDSVARDSQCSLHTTQIESANSIFCNSMIRNSSC